ncbi:ABC transporter [Brachybacterium endophyticum]|uniref:UvrABC system protein A n=1 Tax=Brachybacterium endophyticum TaxID=2182385 RepID=A0A2U2RI32_9MICO|nr:excinuclease ABC subunit UvrA [Brachybacterium endophyticum]PWH05516.1 ABC transporter [Brachybacterium endophyticum]
MDTESERPRIDRISVRGASEHNLRDLDVDIPRDTVVAFTGISGSGKSSLAFGTLYTQSRQRYLESVSPYARRLIDQGAAPRVRRISGLPPAVALRQQHSAGSRSSVGTVSRISNVLRMLFSRSGTYPEGYRPADLAGSFPRDAAPLDSDSFSPNTAVGACRVCSGLGRQLQVDESLLVGDADLSIEDGAIAAWPGAFGGKNYRRILRILGVDVDAPFRSLPAGTRHWVLTTDEQPTVAVDRRYKGTYMSPKRWVEHTFKDSPSARNRAKAAAFMSDQVCPACHGKRLNPEALAVTIAGHDIAEASQLPLVDLRELLASARTHPDTQELAAERHQAALALVDVLEEHLATLIDLGLGYLATGRPTSTLSSGELQRLHLATQLRSGLFGVLYVLDEPSAGLHPSDTELLLDALARLRDEGNTVFVVEHSATLIRSAEWIVDMGPGAGRYGGDVLFNGPAEGLGDVTGSATARYLREDPPVVPGPPAPRTPSGWITVHGVTGHNLDGADVRLPLGALSAITGVSGSGKTSVLTVLADAVRDRLDESPADDTESTAGESATDALTEGVPLWDLGVDELHSTSAEGLEAIDRLVVVDQKPIGRSSRSNLATYTGLFETVRRLFASLPAAKERGFGVGRFSFNQPQGRCPHCLGDGVVSIELLFMPTETTTCPVCRGRRYNPETLEVEYRGHSIADVLAMSVDDAAELLADVPAAHRILQLLTGIGLGYVSLGQSAPTLSGGEAQRIKLVSELHRAPRGHSLYLLDEPTTGLHPADIDLLIGQLQKLVDGGSTVVIAEHDVRTLAACDHLVDMGPGAGDDGGQVIAEGTPDAVATTEHSRTARHLRAAVEKRRAAAG